MRLGCWLLVLCAAGCIERRQSRNPDQVNTLQLTLLKPTTLGSPSEPVEVQQVTFDLRVNNERGEVVPRDLDVDVYISFGGVKTGGAAACEFSQTPAAIETVQLIGGEITNHTVSLPQAFGPTSLWLEERESHIVGASPTIYFRNPYISDVQTPVDLMAPNATFCTPFNKKFVIVDTAQNEAAGGKLVVSSVFGNAFSVTDTGAKAFNSIFVFSFGRPPSYIVRGRVLDEVSGNVSKFIGFTELNFPLFKGTDEIDPGLLPPPTVLAVGDIKNIPKLLGAVSGEVKYSGTVCNPLPDNPNNDPFVEDARAQWLRFNSFVIDGTAMGICESINGFTISMPSKVLGTFDPLMNVGKPITVTGMLKNSSGQNAVLDAEGNPLPCAGVCVTGSCIEGFCRKNPFNFWTIQLRGPSDVTVP